MGLDYLLSVLQHQKNVTDHPDWPRFKERKLPAVISFYYESKKGNEAYWEAARIIKLDISRMLLIIEGTHGDPLSFDIFKIRHGKNAKTGESIQDTFFDLIRMWQDIYE